MNAYVMPIALVLAGVHAGILLTPVRHWLNVFGVLTCSVIAVATWPGAS